MAVLAFSGVARADRMDEAWQRGNEAYVHGDYAAAIAAYQELRDRGARSSDLFFNLGDAYFRAGSLGPAVWAFEEALVLDPGNDDARFNLAAARKAADHYLGNPERVPEPSRDDYAGQNPAPSTRSSLAVIEAPAQDRDPLWVRIVTSLSASTETWLFTVAYLGLFGLLFWRQWAGAELRAGLGIAAGGFAVGALLTGALVLGRVQFDRLSFGIVLPAGVEVKEGADPTARTSFSLHAGARVRLVDSDQDWVRIRLGNGLEGWLRAADVGKL